MSIDPVKYGKPIADLIQDKTMEELGPGQSNSLVYNKLRQIGPEDLFPNQNIKNKEMAKCCLSALWLYHDFLDESHAISQQIPTRSGSYWHGIMHRREPDASNAKYWFRRVEEHPIFPLLYNKAYTFATNCDPMPTFLRENEKWDPFAYIDLVEESRGQDSSLEEIAKQIQQAEWMLLFDYCYDKSMR